MALLETGCPLAARDVGCADRAFLFPDSFTLIYVVRVRRDFDFRWMAALFGVFILSCGATHALSIVTLWHPIYVFEGTIKAVTALASLPTAIVLVWLTPRAIAIPSPRQQSAANEEVRRLNRELESRVEERTAALAKPSSDTATFSKLNPAPMWVRKPDGERFSQ